MSEFSIHGFATPLPSDIKLDGNALYCALEVSTKGRGPKSVSICTRQGDIIVPNSQENTAAEIVRAAFQKSGIPIVCFEQLYRDGIYTHKERVMVPAWNVILIQETGSFQTENVVGLPLCIITGKSMVVLRDGPQESPGDIRFRADNSVDEMLRQINPAEITERTMPPRHVRKTLEYICRERITGITVIRNPTTPPAP